MEPKRGRKRDQSVEDDRLRTIIQMIVDQEGMNPSKLVREAGFDTASKEWRAAYQAIKRWSEGRESKVQKPKDREKKDQEPKDRESKDREKKPGEYFARHLPLKYRRQLFIYIRNHHWDEYIKPLPPGERWITVEERERWYSDTHSTDWVRRDPDDLEDFVGYIKSRGIITQVTRHSVSAEVNYLSGESTARMYGPAGGLTEEDYQRLAYDDLSREALAWGVIDNLLWKKGLLSSQIQRTRRLFAERSLTDLIEANSFEVVADALYEEVMKAPKKKQR
jgi:hypothetical protein